MRGLGFQQSSSWALCVTHDTFGNKKRKGNRMHFQLCQETYKRIFLVKAMRFCQVVPVQTADVHDPVRAASRETPSGIPPRGLELCDHCGSHYRQPMSIWSPCPMLHAPDTPQPGKHVIIPGSQAASPCLEMPFGEVNTSPGSLAFIYFQSVVLN